MVKDDLLSQRITGIQPFNELPIDADVWREAHGQHHSHRLLHSAWAHRPGIVYGLEVVSSRAADREIVVAPGVAIDGQGRTILLSEPVRFIPEEKGQAYVILAYEDTLDARSEVLVGTGKKYYRLVEGRQVILTKELPKTSYLELARIDRSGKEKPIREAKNPFDPAEDELNLLYRQLAFPHCYADGGIAELALLPLADPGAWKPNRAGLTNLIREANGQGFHLGFEGTFNLRTAGNEDDALMLYVSCGGEFQPMSAEQTDGLRRYLDNGGTVFAEAAGGAAGFAKSFAAIAEAVGAKLQDVGDEPRLLGSHLLFPAPPPGAASNGSLRADLDRGVFLSTHDYGGAWQGRQGNRDLIRTAVEFGMNVVAYAARRRREAQLARM